MLILKVRTGEKDVPSAPRTPMKILLILAAMYLICDLSGRLIANLISGRGRRLPIAPQVGYAYTLIGFYGFYMIFKSATTAAWMTLALPVIANGVWLIVRVIRRQPLLVAASESKDVYRDHRKDILYPLIASVLVVGFAAWPYVLCGWGNYWHSGNEDIEDGLNGRDAYLDGTIFDSTQKGRSLPGSREQSSTKSKGDPSRGDLLRAMNALPKRLPQEMSANESFASGVIPLQYSSLAFWSVVFGDRHGLDIFLEQGLTDLLLMMVGVYYLSRDAFWMSSTASAFAGGASVLTTFYLGTYFAGHGGSMMYGALIPALLYLVLAKAPSHLSLPQVSTYSAIILGAICLSYPFPLPLVLPAALGYRFWVGGGFGNRMARFWQFLLRHRAAFVLVVAAVALALVLFSWEFWSATAVFRWRQAHQYRPWGYTHDWLIVPLYLGLLPPPVAGSLFLVALIGVRGYWLLVAVSSILSIILIWIYREFRPEVNRGFVLLFGISCIPLYFIFRFMIADSYYIYKFLYTHQFLIVMGTVGFCFMRGRRAVRIGCCLLLLTNLVMDGIMGEQIYKRPYNHDPQRLAEFSKIDRRILEHSYVVLTGGEATAVRQTLLAMKAEHELDFRAASYFIVPANREADIIENQFPPAILRIGSQLSIRPAPLTDGLMARTTRSEPEAASSDPRLGSTVFRWMGGRQNTDILGIYIFRPAPLNDSRRYLRICVESGPSATGNIPLSVATDKGTVLAKVLLSGLQCVWLPAHEVIGAPQPLLVQSVANGKSLLPFDDRILLYRVFGVGWSDETYDDRALSFFNSKQDIIVPDAYHAKVRLQLGAGWGSYETYHGEHFRWAGVMPELVLTGLSGDGLANVKLTVEPGPSHGATPLILSLVNSSGNEVFRSGSITNREILQFQLHYIVGVRSIFHLHSNAEHLRLKADPRILDYRVFAISAH